MLLGIAGVSREDICADYSLSMAYLSRRYRKMSQKMPYGKIDEDGRPSLLGGFFATLPTYMDKTLDYLEEHYGGIVPYVKSCSVKNETIAAIRDKFVEQ